MITSRDGKPNITLAEVIDAFVCNYCRSDRQSAGSFRSADHHVKPVTCFCVGSNKLRLSSSRITHLHFCDVFRNLVTVGKVGGGGKQRCKGWESSEGSMGKIPDANLGQSPIKYRPTSKKSMLLVMLLQTVMHVECA